MIPDALQVLFPGFADGQDNLRRIRRRGNPSDLVEPKPMEIRINF